MKPAFFVFSLLLAAVFVAGGDIRVDDESMSDQIDDLNLAADAAAATTAAAAATTQPAAATTAGESFCQRVLDVVNQVRTSPKTFAARLGGYNNPNQWSAHSSCSDGDDPKCMFTRSDNVKFLTHEGVKGIQNAIDFLNKQSSLPALSAAPGLCNAAADMVKDQGPSGEIGHVGPRGSSILSRVATHGKFHADISEIVQYGSFLGDGTDESGPFDIVAQLVVGDGDATKAHRAELVSPVWKEAGAEMGDHITYGKMSCILFTDGFTAH